MTPRYAHRLDGPHSAIVQALRQCGCAVLDLSRVGNGCPDLLVWRRDVAWLVEVKTGTVGKLTTEQRRFLEQWPGPVAVLRSVDEAVTWAVGARATGGA